MPEGMLMPYGDSHQGYFGKNHYDHHDHHGHGDHHGDRHHDHHPEHHEDGLNKLNQDFAKIECEVKQIEQCPGKKHKHEFRKLEKEMNKFERDFKKLEHKSHEKREKRFCAFKKEFHHLQHDLHKMQKECHGKGPCSGKCRHAVEKAEKDLCKLQKDFCELKQAYPGNHPQVINEFIGPLACPEVEPCIQREPCLKREPCIERLPVIDIAGIPSCLPLTRAWSGKRGKRGKRGHRGRPGCPGRTLNTMTFGGTRLIVSGAPVEPFYLVAGGNSTSVTTLAATSPPTGGYEQVALECSHYVKVTGVFTGTGTSTASVVYVTVNVRDTVGGAIVSSVTVPLAMPVSTSRVVALRVREHQLIDVTLATSVPPTAPVAAAVLTSGVITLEFLHQRFHNQDSQRRYRDDDCDDSRRRRRDDDEDSDSDSSSCSSSDDSCDSDDEEPRRRRGKRSRKDC